MPSWPDLLVAPAETGVFLDFDGTLSPIVVDPTQSQPVAGAVDALGRLAERFARVAVVSGRPVAFLVDRLDLDSSGVHAYGLYGLESYVDGVVSAQPDALAWRAAVDAAADAAERAAPTGVGVERKGLTVTLHVRPAPQHDEWARHFAEAEAAERGLKLDTGRLSYELRPPIDIDKGTVVTRLLRDLSAAGFVGDDRGDLLAFDALDRFTANGGTAVKAAVRSAEAPPELLERADEILENPVDVVRRLRALADPGGA